MILLLIASRAYLASTQILTEFLRRTTARFGLPACCAAIAIAATTVVIAAPLQLLPFENFECSGEDCPLDFAEATDSGTSAAGAFPRSRSEGAAFKTNTSEATVGMRFQVCEPASARLLVRGVYQGLLRGTGGGINNRGVVRGSLDLRNLTTGESVDKLTIIDDEERGKSFQTITTIISALEVAQGFDPGIQTFQDLDPGNVFMLGYTLRTSASGANALSDFNRIAPPRFGQFLQYEIELTPNLPDTDGDGLYDDWENDGVKDCEGNVLVDLPALGADPNHKDIFIEYDWLPGEQPSKSSIDTLKNIFAKAPVDNPDGEMGIRLWIDTGSLTEPGLQEGVLPGSCFDTLDNDDDGLIDADDPLCRVGDNFGGGSEIDLNNVPNGEFVPRTGDDADGNGEPDFFEVRALEYDEARRAVFHYAISGPKGPGEDPAIGRSSCSDGLNNDGDALVDKDDSVDCFGGGQGGGGNFFVINAGTALFLHELGHSLGLGHGGRDSENDKSDADNCKPNYLSIMNYSFSGGVPADLDGDGVFETKTLDYAPVATPEGRAASPIDDLVEDQLVETGPLDDSDSVHATRFVDGKGIGRTSAANAPIDWNGVNGIEDGEFEVNINRGDKDGSPPDCEKRSANKGHPSDETIVSYNDWRSLRYRFPVRSSFDSRGPIIDPEPPVEPEDVDQVYFATDLSIDKTVNPDPWVAGQTVEYQMTVKNNGPNGVPAIEVSDTPPQGVNFINVPENCGFGVDETLRCSLAPLPVGASDTVTLQARLPVTRECGRSQFVTLSNNATVKNVRGREIDPSNNSIDIRHRILCPAFEYAAKFVCGRQTDPNASSLLSGRYGSVVNIHNPQSEKVFAFAKLALAAPPGELKPGEITSIDLFTLDYDEATAADCDYVLKRVYGDEEAPEVIDGFLVIQSALSLDVTAVYTRRGLEENPGEGNIDVERIVERAFSSPEPKAELRPEILATNLSCNAGECLLSVQYLVENLGDAASGKFSTRAVTQPSGNELSTDDWPLGLAPGFSEVRSFNFESLQTVISEQDELCIEVDLPGEEVAEIDETNNVVCFELPNFNN